MSTCQGCGGTCLEKQLNGLGECCAAPAPLDRARFESAPCYLCGYNGRGYFQPSTHPCAAQYHDAHPAAPAPKLSAVERWYGKPATPAPDAATVEQIMDLYGDFTSLRAAVEQIEQRALRAEHSVTVCKATIDALAFKIEKAEQTIQVEFEVNESMRVALYEEKVKLERAEQEATSFAANLRGKHATSGATYQHLVDRAEKAEQEADVLRELLEELWGCECYGWSDELAARIVAALKEGK